VTEPAGPGHGRHGASYAGAGVDIAAGERAVELMRASVARASRPEVVGGLGGFAGLFRADFARYERPLLATSTDGVGTKVAIAQQLDIHDTIGFDLVGMVVDDLVVCGAEPLFLTDYIATGKVVPERIAAIVAGIAKACEVAGAALIGGETAEHPGLLGPDEYDVAGAATGVVDEPKLLGPHRVTAGDAVIALGSSGLHSNGYALVRHVFFEQAGWDVHRHVAVLGRTLGEELLEPTRIYAPDCRALAEAGAEAGAGVETGGVSVDVHAMAHVTGGGLAANLARVMPAHLDAVLDRSTWSPQPIFGLIGQLGGVAVAELERTFNQGVGMVAVVAAGDADRALELLASRTVPAWVIGLVEFGTGGARLVSSHPG